MTTIKFCGLTRPEDAAVAAELGATHVGVIFAPSARQVSVETARKVFDAAGTSLQHVGVFTDSSAKHIAAVALEARLDVVQLHRKLDDAFIDELRRTFAGDIWPVVGVKDAQKAIKRMENAPIRCNAVVLDTDVNGKTGGTGKAFDWVAMRQALADDPRPFAIVVAGGLTPQNVPAAISALKPDIVDVSSGIESAPGVKDHNLMRAFAEAVHSASIV